MVWTTFAFMPTFHDIQVQSVHRETAESVVVALDIPDALRPDFQFAAGQYLTLRTTIDGEDIRRSYSLCSSPGEGHGTWASRMPGGKFSTYANDVLKAGDTLQVMDLKAASCWPKAPASTT